MNNIRGTRPAYTTDIPHPLRYATPRNTHITADGLLRGISIDKWYLGAETFFRSTKG